ncbi:hypothetical protein EMIHUDRAFT_234580 [Emiliania huxleyi CCMP1516]|uniref:Uncharacterized protein n=2 Tax=Emiliania huxleyi TaxID=2903 RepID=A0A0D3JZ22_EMIH1|nr:hypothetical protein EMIHUDRAFT_234580 [Emiliania huxleyi CCMP1516]EOD28757.1 hypothetical protein EMIHUDRAFT_234580 [Emiliania huxleyi CCMP1516]|eukprot:XP_005781186.1 hypothetical protein EMIHUDRAFT_234580 [Emiliania huxleyi CCMP1516]
MFGRVGLRSTPVGLRRMGMRAPFWSYRTPVTPVSLALAKPDLPASSLIIAAAGTWSQQRAGEHFMGAIWFGYPETPLSAQAKAPTRKRGLAGVLTHTS